MSHGARRVDLALLAPVVAAGALLGHGIGYGIAGFASTTDHGHLALAWPTVSVAAALGCLVLAVRQFRRSGALVSRVQLAVGHVVAYLLLESIEAVATSPVEHLTSTGFVLGLVLQPIVALALWRLLHAGLRLLSPCRQRLFVPTSVRASSMTIPQLVVVGSGAPLGAPHRRGPPQLPS